MPLIQLQCGGNFLCNQLHLESKHKLKIEIIRSVKLFIPTFLNWGSQGHSLRYRAHNLFQVISRNDYIMYVFNYEQMTSAFTFTFRWSDGGCFEIVSSESPASVAGVLRYLLSCGSHACSAATYHTQRPQGMQQWQQLDVAVFSGVTEASRCTCVQCLALYKVLGNLVKFQT